MSTKTNPFQDRINEIRSDYENARLAGVLAGNLIAQHVDDYSDQFPFILELIQNAVDSASDGKRVKIRFRLEKESSGWTLIVSNNGSPFSLADVDRLCGVSEQRKGAGKIGYKGLGFKTISLVTDNPRVFSKDCQFEFNRALHPGLDQLWIVIPHWIEASNVPESVPSPNEWVSFSLPVRHDVSLNDLSDALDGLTSGRGVALLLFLRDLDELTVENSCSGCCMTVKKNIDPADPLVCELLHSPCDDPASKGKLLGSWIVTDFPSRRKMGKQLEISPKALDEYRRKRGSEPNCTDESLGVRSLISLAFRTLTDDETGFRFRENLKGTICAFFPIRSADGSGLRFLVQADFLTTQNREALLPNSVWNQWLFDNLHRAIVSAVQEFKDRPEWNQIIYDSMPLEKEGKGAFHEVTKSLCEMLSKSRIVLTDAPEDRRWICPAEAAWIDSTAIRDLISGCENWVFSARKLLVSAQVISDETNRQRAGHFLKSMGVEVIKDEHVRQLLCRQEFLDSKAEDIGWFHKLFIYLDQKGISDRLIKQLSGIRFIPTSAPGVLAGIGDVFISTDESLSFDGAVIVNKQILQEPKIERLLANRFRIPVGADNFIKAVILSRRPGRQSENVMWNGVRFVKTYYEQKAGSQAMDHFFQTEIKNEIRLKAADGEWRLIKDLHMPGESDPLSEIARTVAVYFPEDPDRELWQRFFKWLGVRATPAKLEMSAKTADKNGVDQVPNLVDKKATPTDRVADGTASPMPPGTEGGVTVLGLDTGKGGAPTTADNGAPTSVALENRSGITQDIGCAGERIAFAYVRDQLLIKFAELTPQVEQNDAGHFLIVSGGNILAEGLWGNGGKGGDELPGDWGEHYDFLVSVEGRKHYYEVKATLDPASVMSQKGGDKVRLTPAESEWAAQVGSDYHVVRVYGVGDSAIDANPKNRLIIIDDPLSMLSNGNIGIDLIGSLPDEYKVRVSQIGPRS